MARKNNAYYENVLGNRLYEARIQCRIDGKKATQAGVAEWIENNVDGCEAISSQTISDYERGRTAPQAPVLAALARLYNVSCDYLLGNTVFKNPANEDIKKRLGLSDAAINQLEWISTQNERMKQGAQRVKEAYGEEWDPPVYWKKELTALNTLLSLTSGGALLNNLYEYLYGNYDVVVCEALELPGKTLMLGNLCLRRKSEVESKDKNFEGSAFTVSEIQEMFLVKIQNNISEMRRIIQNKEE